jgi:hypothetical protein
LNDDILYSSIEKQNDILNLPRWQLDLQAELYKFKLSLLGLIRNESYGLEVIDEETNKKFYDMREYVPLPGANLVNEKGATAIHNKLAAELTKIPSDTNFDKEVIGSDFPVWLAKNHEFFGLSDENYNTICESAVRLVKGAMYRSLGGWKGELINNNIQQREVINNNTMEVEKQKPKIMGFMGR